MFDFSTLAVEAITSLKTQFLAFVPEMFGFSIVVLGAFVGLRLMKGGVKAGASK